MLPLSSARPHSCAVSPAPVMRWGMNHLAPRARTHSSAAGPRLFLFLFLLRFPSSCGAGEGRSRGAEAGLRGRALPLGPVRRFFPKPPP